MSAFNTMLTQVRDRNWGGTSQSVACEPYISGYAFVRWFLPKTLESYIEEPNIWSSWKRIYLEGKSIMDDLVQNNAITDWIWDGDQDATAWDQLKVNNEADCRQGKYKLQIHFKDVPTMQEITVDLIIDQASNSVTASFNN